MADPRRTVEVLLSTHNQMRPGLQAGTTDLRAFAQQGVQSIGGLASSILNLRNLVAGGLFGAALNRITSEGDEIKDTSDRLSVTAREYQVLSHAMALSGGSAGDVQVAFKTMASLLYDAGEEGKKAQATMQALGLNLSELKGMTPYEQFQALAQALAKVTDANARAAMAQDVFGRGSMALIPMIKETGGNMDELARKMDIRGQFLSDEQVQRAGAFKDSLSELNKAVSVAAFEALGETIAGLTSRIMELVESGELKKWGKEAASTVTSLAVAVGRVADVIVNHRDAVIALAVAYAGLRIVLGAMDAIATVRLALTGLIVTQMAATAATVANTAATVANTAAMRANNAERELAAFEKFTVGINKADAATLRYAASATPLVAALSRVAGILNAVAMGSVVAFAGWKVGEKIGEVTGLHAALANMASGLFVDGSIGGSSEATRNAALLAANQGQPAHQLAAARKSLRVTGGAKKSDEKAETPDEQAKREWEALKKTVEAVWTAARVGEKTGDTAAVSLWEKVSGAKGVAGQLSAADIARIGANLQAVIRDDADASVKVLKAAADAQVKAIAEGAEKQKKATEDATEARQKLARMDIEDLRQGALDRVAAIQAAADKEAEALEKSAEKKAKAAEKARAAWDNLVAGKSADGKTDEERDQEKDEKAREKTLTRRAKAVLKRMDDGGYVTAEGREIAQAYLGRQRAGELQGEAADDRRAKRGAERRGEAAGKQGDKLRGEFAAADRAGERAGLVGTATGANGEPVPAATVPQGKPAKGAQAVPSPVPQAVPVPGSVSAEGAIAYLSMMAAELRIHTPILGRIAQSGGGLV
jgi:hypothetical protein